MNENNDNAISVSGAETTALAPYTALSEDLRQVKDIITENLGAGGISEFDLTKIKVPSGGGIAFELVDPVKGTEVSQSFRAIIIAAHDIRGYWPESIDETGGVPPQCHSNDAITGIGAPGGSCTTCPLAQFGSEIKQNGERGAGQACKQMKQLLLLREGTGSFLPEVLNVPPTSLGPYRKHAFALAGRKAPVSSVVTEFSLAKQKSAGGVTYAQLAFKPVAALGDGDLAQVRQYSSFIKPMFETQPRQLAAAPTVKAPPPQAGNEAF
jgi:hypothetical protein